MIKLSNEKEGGNVRYRIERDALGEKQVPAEAYYGIHSLRSKENFDITKRGINRQMIKALAYIKKACAKANSDVGYLENEKAKVIMLACDEILNGRLHGQFITDLIQGGAGTSMNMNANEVIANRANEMLGGKKGVYDLVHPLDHVNFGQSTNDVIPTAGKIAVIRQTKKLLVELKKLQTSFSQKGNEFSDIIKIGKTHLQDAAPMTLGSQFDAFSVAISKDIKRIESAIEGLLEINIGATVIGTGINADPKYAKKAIQNIAKYTGEDFKQAKNLYDATRNIDGFLNVSSAIKVLAVNLSKIANDLRLLSSGYTNNEIILPMVQAGSTIIPGKINPVVLEVVNQVAFYVFGMDATITKACEAGQLELNVYLPVVLATLFEGLNTIRRAARTLREKAIDGIKANITNCHNNVINCPTIVMALIPHIGYEQALSIALESKETGESVYEITAKKGLLSESEIANILNINNLTTPGIAGEDLYKKKA